MRLDNKKSVKIAVLCFILLTISVSTTLSGEWSVGAGGVINISPYKSYDTTIMPFPLVAYDSQRLYVKGTSLGVNLLKNDLHKLSLGASYHGMSFDPDKTTDNALKTLDKRHSTLMAEASYSLTSKFGVFRANVSQDVLGKSNGTLGNLTYCLPMVTEKFTLLPGFGIQWSSSKYNEYYYGVSRVESARSGLEQYKSGDALSPTAMLGIEYKITERWKVMGAAKVEYLTGKVKDSPIVGKKYAASIMAGVQFTF